MPNSMSNKSGFYEDDQQSGGKEEEKSNKPTANNSKKPAGAKDGGKGMIGANGPNSSGWFGGIFNKFSLKPKNQMILPDDKNPSVS
jgi:COPII coat assembly protein SEC16